MEHRTMLHYTIHFFSLWRSNSHPFCLFSMGQWTTGLVLSYLPQYEKHSTKEHHNWVVSIAALYPAVPAQISTPKQAFVKWFPGVPWNASSTLL